MSMSDAEIRAAAARIQAGWRTSRTLDAATRLNDQRDKQANKSAKEEMESAARRIGAFMRGSLARQKTTLLQAKRIEEDAAERIGAIIRGQLARKSTIKLKEEVGAAKIIQARLRGKASRRLSTDVKETLKGLADTPAATLNGLVSLAKSGTSEALLTSLRRFPLTAIKALDTLLKLTLNRELVGTMVMSMLDANEKKMNAASPGAGRKAKTKTSALRRKTLDFALIKGWQQPTLQVEEIDWLPPWLLGCLGGSDKSKRHIALQICRRPGAEQVALDARKVLPTFSIRVLQGGLLRKLYHNAHLTKRDKEEAFQRQWVSLAAC